MSLRRNRVNTYLYRHDRQNGPEELFIDQRTTFILRVELNQRQTDPPLLRVPLVTDDRAPTLLRRIDQANDPIVRRGVDHLTQELGLSGLVIRAGRVEFSQRALEGGHELGDHVFGAEDVVGVGAHLRAAEGLDGQLERNRGEWQVRVTGTDNLRSFARSCSDPRLLR
jgi:hypothetical protein